MVRPYPLKYTPLDSSFVTLVVRPRPPFRVFSETWSDGGKGSEEQGGYCAERLFIKDCLFWRVILKKRKERKNTLHAVVFQRGLEAAAD